MSYRQEIVRDTFLLTLLVELLTDKHWASGRLIVIICWWSHIPALQSISPKFVNYFLSYPANRKPAFTEVVVMSNIDNHLAYLTKLTPMADSLAQRSRQYNQFVKHNNTKVS